MRKINNGMFIFSLLGPKLDFFNILQNRKCVFYGRAGLTAKIVDKKVILPWVSNLVPPPYFEVSNKMSPAKGSPWGTRPTKSAHSTGGGLNYSPTVKDFSQ